MNSNRFLITLLLVFFYGMLSAQIIKDNITISHTEIMFAKTKELAKNRTHQLFDIFNTKLTADEILGLKYLYAYMPLSDLADYNGDFYLANVRQSLKARQELKWGNKIPEDVFLHFVLPLRVNNENLDSFRIIMYDELKNRVKNLSMNNAAIEVNHWCHEKVTYKPSDERTSSPLSTIRYSFGRCGEESTFTVAAMRMVGIPARQVYTPRWAHSDDNHAWVEVWIDGKWHFLGACEPESSLDMGWFAGPARRAMLVHTRAYGWYNGNDPVISSGERFSELNLIANYAPVKKFYVKVIDSLKHPVEKAKVEFQLYNYAEFYPIAKTETNKDGFTDITCGLGDLIIWANYGNRFNYKKITVESTDTLVLQLLYNHPASSYEEYDMVPPVERTPAPNPEINKNGNAGLLNDSINSAYEVLKQKENNARLQNEDLIRTTYMKSFRDSAWAAGFAAKLHISKDSCTRYILSSFGNWREITSFLEKCNPSKRLMALQLLSFLSEKDLRDVKATTLFDHLDYLVLQNSDESFPGYLPNVLSPRIGNEILSPWRHFLQLHITFPAKKAFSTPLLINWIKDSLIIDNNTNAHSRAPLTPSGVYELKIADNRSRDIFFVAVCRAFGQPARLNPETSFPEYWNGGNWATIEFEKKGNKPNPKGFIHLLNPSPTIVPVYATHFTIEYFRDGVYRSLLFEDGKPLNQFPDVIETDAGKYLLVCGNRLPDGSVLSSLRFFEVKPGGTMNISVKLREQSTPDKIIGKLNISDFQLIPYDYRKIVVSDSLSAAKSTVLIFIEPDKEPSKHVMNDLVPVKKNIEKWGGKFLFVLSREKTSSAFRPSNYTGLAAQSNFYFDQDGKLLAAVEKLIAKKLGGEYPLILIIDKDGNLYYFSSGYKIGIGEQLVKKLK